MAVTLRPSRTGPGYTTPDGRFAVQPLKVGAGYTITDQHRPGARPATAVSLPQARSLIAEVVAGDRDTGRATMAARIQRAGSATALLPAVDDGPVF